MHGLCYDLKSETLESLVLLFDYQCPGIGLHRGGRALDLGAHPPTIA